MTMTNEKAPRERDQQPFADVSKAPLPTAQTLRGRRNLAYQLTRFVSFNGRIVRMVLKGDH